MTGWFNVNACTDPVRQREEMIQVAAVTVQIVEYLDRQIKGEKDDFYYFSTNILLLYVYLFTKIIEYLDRRIGLWKSVSIER